MLTHDAEVTCGGRLFRARGPATKKHTITKVKGKVYRSCITSILRYVSDTWAMKVEDMARFERTEENVSGS